MPHPRQLIRKKVRDLLVSRTAAGLRVLANEELSLRTKDLPQVRVYSLGEDVEADSDSTAPRELTRTLQLFIDAVVGMTAGVDDAMDELALQIETVMHADPYLGGLAGDSILRTTEIGIEPDGDRLVGRIGLTYEVTYRTMAPEAPALAGMDDFLVAGVNTNLGGLVHEDDDAHDEVVVQESP